MHAISKKPLTLSCPEYIRGYKLTSLHISKTGSVARTRKKLIKFIDQHEMLIGGDFR